VVAVIATRLLVFLTNWVTVKLFPVPALPVRNTLLPESINATDAACSGSVVEN